MFKTSPKETDASAAGSAIHKMSLGPKPAG